MPTHAPDLLPTPPGGRGLPVLGETLEFIGGFTKFLESRRNRYGPIFVASLFGKPTVFMRGAEANRWIYAGEGKYLENEWTPAIAKLFATGSTAMLSGAEHKARRKLLAPHFRRTRMEDCIPAMVDITGTHLAQWATDAEHGPLTILPRMRALSLEIVANYVLGDISELGVSLAEFSREFNTWVAGMFVPFALAIPGGKFARALAARKRMLALLGELVGRRAAEQRRGPDLLSVMLDARDDHGEPLPHPVLVDELLQLLFAGNDTTVTASVNLMYHLCVHPEAAIRTQIEQDGLDDRGFCLTSIQAMTYLEAVIKESMRVVPFGGGFRVMLEERNFAGFRIPKGWRIAVGPHAVHFEDDYYRDPQRFDPQRWLDPHARPPFAYIPFGGGPRTCLGMHFALLQMHVVLALLLREYEWDLVPGQDLRFNELPLPNLRSGLIVDLRRRAR